MRTPLRLRRAKAGAPTPRWKSRLLDVTILLVAAFICVFAFSFSTRLSYSRPQVREAPEIVRIQILNGSGRPGLARHVADHLSALPVGKMRFDPIDVGNFDRADIKQTLFINRRLGKEQFDQIMAAWTLGAVDRTDEHARSNDLGVDLTIVLGKNAVDPTTLTQQSPPPSAGDKP